MVFWLVLIAAAAVVTASLLLVLRRGGAGGAQAANDITVYRDQLREIDRDLERGLIDDETAARTRLEVSRRILAADDRGDASALATAPAPATTAAALFTGLVVVGGSLGLYAWLGAPGYGDLPLKARLEAAEQMRATRPDQAAAEAQVAQAGGMPQTETNPEHAALVAELREAMKNRPDDPRGWVLLARHEAALGNFAAAHAAQKRLIELQGDAVTAQDYADYADLLILAAGGYVSPEAEVALAEALKRDPANGVARYYSGEMLMQTGRPDQAFVIWRDLLREGPEDAPWIPPIRAQIEEAAMRAGIPFEMPAPALPGPSADDMAAAADMTPEERMEMVRGMVGNLSDRLATTGGTPQEWARLISALGVLGETGQAQAIWQEAQETFAASPDALSLLRDAAKGAGLTR